MIVTMSFEVGDDGESFFGVKIEDLSIGLQMVVMVEDPLVCEWSPEQNEVFRNDVNLLIEQAREAFHQQAVAVNRHGHHAYFGITPEEVEPAMEELDEAEPDE